MLRLRDDQTAALGEIQANYRAGIRRVLLVAPCAFGKSTTVAYMTARTRMTTLIMVHREQLLDMTSAGLTVPHAVIRPGKRITKANVYVGMMQTIARRLDELPRFQWIISDECHLAMSPTWQRTLLHYPDAFNLGLSASPERLDGKGLGDSFDKMVFGPSIRELTLRGRLVPVRAFAPPTLPQHATRSGHEYNLDDAARLYDNAKVHGDAIKHFRRLGGTRQTLGFCSTRAHAEHTAQAFRMAGFRAAAVDSTTPNAGQVIRDFKAGKLQLLFSVELLTTGFDYPECACLIFLRPTSSIALFTQMVGRGVRTFLGKTDCVVIDHVGNFAEHGMPDEPREWTLEGKLKRDRAPAVAQCPECYACHAPMTRCPACGYAYAVIRPAAKAPPKADDTTLVEFLGRDFRSIPDDRMKTAPLKALLRLAVTADDIRAIGRARDYSPGWAQRIIKIRHSHSRAST